MVVATRALDFSVAVMSSDPLLNTIFDDEVTIQLAARATVAAPGYFEPVKIGRGQLEYIDGGMGANNPVQHALSAAKTKWPGRPICCLVSVGSGRIQNLAASTSGLVAIAQLLKNIATETERTAAAFADLHQDMVNNDSYFRFNVEKGLDDVRFDSLKSLGLIEAATSNYLNAHFTHSQLTKCAKRLSETVAPPSHGSGFGLASEGESETSPFHAHAPSIPNVPRSETEESREANEKSHEIPDQNPHEAPASEFKRQPIIPGESREGVAMISIIANIILQDFELQSWIVSATNKIGKERMAKNLNILLEEFARDLRQVEDAYNLAAFVSYKL